MAVTRVGRTLLPRLDTSLNSSVDLSQIPAAQPPAGVTPNFVNPPSLDTVYRVSVYLFVPLMFVFVVIRLYARFRLVRKVGADDSTHNPYIPQYLCSAQNALADVTCSLVLSVLSAVCSISLINCAISCVLIKVLGFHHLLLRYCTKA